jgi:predicted membrane protein
MSDLLSLPLEFINNIIGQIPSDQAIPYFAPFYNLTVILWMAAIAAIIVAPFWKRFRAFAVFLTWMAIFFTLVQRGSSSQRGEIDALQALFNISFSTAILIIFVVLTLWIFGRLLSGKKAVPMPKVSQWE